MANFAGGLAGGYLADSAYRHFNPDSNNPLPGVGGGILGTAATQAGGSWLGGASLGGAATGALADTPVTAMAALPGLLAYGQASVLQRMVDSMPTSRHDISGGSYRTRYSKKKSTCPNEWKPDPADHTQLLDDVDLRDADFNHWLGGERTDI